MLASLASDVSGHTVNDTVSIVVPAYNEARSLESVLERVQRCAAALRSLFPVELIVVDDGSNDETPQILARLVDADCEVRVIRHETNAGLVAAIRTGVLAARYETIVVLDADLSYDPAIVGPLVAARRRSGAAVAIASPYMAGGHVANVPLDRLVASRVANWLLSLCARGRIKTLTGMVRAYDAKFLKELVSRPHKGEFNAWAISKVFEERRAFVEIPASLVWPAERRNCAPRLSSWQLFTRLRLVVRTAWILTGCARF